MKHKVERREDHKVERRGEVIIKEMTSLCNQTNCVKCVLMSNNVQDHYTTCTYMTSRE